LDICEARELPDFVCCAAEVCRERRESACWAPKRGQAAAKGEAVSAGKKFFKKFAYAPLEIRFFSIL
jgi:hypothetical protein